MATKTVTYDVLAPTWAIPAFEDLAAERAASYLGRAWLRWTVYQHTSYGDGVEAWAVESHHWTRKAAWRASSRLRFAEAKP